MARGRKKSALGKTAGELLKGKPALFKARPGITPEETEKARQNGIANVENIFQNGGYTKQQRDAMLRNLGETIEKKPRPERNLDPKDSATEKMFAKFKGSGLFKGQERHTVNLAAKDMEGGTAKFRKVESTTWRGANTLKEMSFEKQGYDHPFIRVYADPKKAESFIRKHNDLIDKGGGQAALVPEGKRKISDIDGKYFMELPLLPQKGVMKQYYDDVLKLSVDEKTIRPIRSSVTASKEKEYEVRTRKKEKEWEMDVPANRRRLPQAENLLPPKRGEAFVAPVPGMTDSEIQASREKLDKIEPYLPEEYEVRSRKKRDDGFVMYERDKRKRMPLPAHRNILPPAPAGSAKAAEAEKAAKEGGGGGKGEKSKKAGGGYYGGGGGEAFDMSSVMALLLFLVILAIALGFISMLF